MSKTAVTHDEYLATLANKVRVTHVPTDRTMQVDLQPFGLDFRQQHAIATTLGVRSDVCRANISLGGWLHVEYTHKCLKDAALKRFTEKMENIIKLAIARKMAENA